MPMINIYLQEGRSKESINLIGQGIHQALMEAWGIPKHDCFHIFHEKKPEHLCIDPSMWNMKRSEEVIVIHITSVPRTKEMKLKFYQLLSDILQESISLRPDDMLISIVNNQPEDWSFGCGKAQLEAQQG